jgi:nucleotide-binding universal stress UspA family protein
MLRTILVALDESPFSDTATTLALEWANRFGARLLGLGILDKPSIIAPQPVPLGASAFKKELDEARLAEAQEHVIHFLAKFQERCSAAGVSAETFEDVGDPTKCILKQAHRCDVHLPKLAFCVEGGCLSFHDVQRGVKTATTCSNPR